MMHIESLRKGTEFKVDVKEHNAIITCDPEDLKLVGKRKFAYICPICGELHTVPAYRVEERKTYKMNVDLNDPELPVNVKKKAQAAAEKQLDNLYKRIKRLEKRLSVKTPSDAKSEKSEMSKEVNEVNHND